MEKNYKLIESFNLSQNQSLSVSNNEDPSRRFSHMTSIDITSRLGQFAWRQMTPTSVFLPVIFR